MFWRKKKRSLDDLKAEIESHLALEADQLRDTGQSSDPDGAARRTFGNVTAVEEASYEFQRWMFFDHLMRDFRQALRQMKQRPGLSAIVILTLALGIGATSAIFSVVQAVLLNPLPYKEPRRLAMLFSGDPASELHEGRVSLLNFSDWKSQNRSFEDMTVFNGQTFLLRTKGSPERMRSARVPANFWTLLGVQPSLGRVFTAEEEKRGERVAVLSYRLWQQQFAGSEAALGADLVMDDRTYLVIGVMPPSFRFPFSDTQVWEPITAHPYWTTRDRKNPRAEAVWFALGRVKRGVTVGQAQAEMNGIAHRLAAEYPESQMTATAAVVPLETQATGRFRLSLWLLFASVFQLLLIACTNVAGLLLVRGSVRQREFAMRRALGAGRLRLAGQVVTETLVLSTVAGLLGLLLAWGACQTVKAWGPADIPRLAEASINWPVMLFTAAMTCFTALFASLWPAFESGRTQVGSRQWVSVSTRRVRDFLVAGEFAMALLLLTSAGLLIHSFVRLRAVDLGFQPDHLLSMRIDLHVGRTTDQQAAYFEEAIDRVKALPGVRSAAAISGFLRTDPEDSVEIEGRLPQKPGPCEDLIAGPYFETAGIQLKKGRVFSEQDGRHSLPVAIINETMARTYWPNTDPIGKRFRFSSSTPWLTVVGETGDMRRQGIDGQVAPQAFLPHRQGSENMMDVIVRASSDPAAMAPSIRKTIEAIDRHVAKFKIATVDRELGDQTAERRFDTLLVSSFAFVALFLSAIGIYGLLQHLVGQRTAEIGVRMALGARPQIVMAQVLREGLTLALVGICVGLIGALTVSRLASKLLYAVSPTDPIAFGVSAVLLVAVAGAACWAPSRRASRIDPMVALRQE